VHRFLGKAEESLSLLRSSGAKLDLSTAGWVATVALGELVNTTCSINEALLSCEEGVAAGADTYTDGLHGGLGLEGSAAGARNSGVKNLGVDVSFHGG
jgi:hypothetical protein